MLPENTAACRLYESLGFQYTGVKNTGGTVDMELQLERRQPGPAGAAAPRG